MQQGARFAGCLPTVPLWLHLHRESRSPGSSGWGQVGAERFKSLDSLLSEASGNSHTRETSRHAVKTDILWSEVHSGGCFPGFVHKMKGAGQETFRDLSMKKKSCSSGYKEHRQAGTDTLGVLPSFLPPPEHSPAAGWRWDQTARVTCSSSPCAGLLFAMAAGPIAHSNTQGNSCLIFGERKSILKPPSVPAHHPDKQ